jgi:pimeloyl-ACP methyl ester carboxylesterase
MPQMDTRRLNRNWKNPAGLGVGRVIVVGWRLLGVMGLLLVMSSCATPISVTQADPISVHRDLTRNVLSAGEPSDFSQIILNRAGLFDQFGSDPEATLWTLHTDVVAGRRGMNQVFALAELSFLHAERTKQQPYYFAAAIYAYAFLFPPAGTPAPEPYDPRFRNACDLYNRALTAALQSKDGSRVEPAVGVFPLPFGEIEIAFDPAQLVWLDRTLVDFVPVANLEVKGLRDRYRRAGLGAPVAASTVAGAARAGLDIPQRLKVPATFFLRLEDPWAQLRTRHVQGRLELYVTSDTETVEIGERKISLEAEPTAALAYMLSGSEVWDFELGGFLFGDLFRQRLPTQLFALEPYRPGRIPVVFVHGTASSPARWAEMFNELQNDPRIRPRYQFWFFTYETGNPVIYSAMRLREALETAVATLDPAGQDPALREMVLLGHSQGGLLVKLMVVDLEQAIRAALRTTLENPGLSNETRDLMQKMTAVRPLPFVRRVIFLATPHRGSYVAGNWLAHQVSRLVRLPGQVLRATEDVLTRDPELALRFRGRLSSVYAMTPGSPLITELAPAPLAPGIIGHSIIAVKGEGPFQQDTDGVVAYSSAHLDGMESELVVTSGHSVQQNPEAIEEVRRILLEHATRQ